jgi:pimeloyl-ACP methyl ester carboxylesterase
MIAETEPLHVEISGEGPLVVLAHGFSGSARNWGPQVRWLRERNRVLVYDLRGHARSPAPHARPAAYTREAFRADLGRMLDDAGVEQAVVGGLSLGAGVALDFALHHPERVRGLVLASLPAASGHAGAFRGNATEMAEMLESQGSEATGARFVWGPDSGLDERGAALVRQGFLEHDALGLAQVLRGVLGSIADVLTPDERWTGLRMPTLLIAGSEDGGSLESARALAAQIPHAELHVVEGAGHVVNLAAPKAFNGLLSAFLAAIPKTSRD